MSTYATPLPVTGTVTTSPSGTQDVRITAQTITLAISAASLPLPTGASTEATLSALNSNIAKAYGTWTYYSGISGTVNVTAGQRILSITCHSAIGGTVTINGGSSITVPAGVGFSISMTGLIIAPTVVFSSTDTYFIEVVS